MTILLNENRFRYNPFLSFSKDNDYYGFVVRQNIIESLLPGDAKLRNQLASDIFSQQNPNGSWNDTVISTSNHIETLLELGLSADDPHIQSGADWLFGVFSENVYRQSNNMGGFLVAHSMFSSQNRHEEFKSALAEKPEWNPVGLCYLHLPNIQTGIAVKALIKLGLQDDETVSLTWCNCSRSFLEKLWSGILERQAKVELLESCIAGAKECKFVVIF